MASPVNSKPAAFGEPTMPTLSTARTLRQQQLSWLASQAEFVYLQCIYIHERLIMRTRVQKWGNSLALRIPKSFAIEAGLEGDSPVEITLHDGTILIAPVARPAYSLAQLLAEITPENLHPEVDTGEARGGEAW